LVLPSSLKKRLELLEFKREPSLLQISMLEPLRVISKKRPYYSARNKGKATRMPVMKEDLSMCLPYFAPTKEREKKPDRIRFRQLATEDFEGSASKL